MSKKNGFKRYLCFFLLIILTLQKTGRDAGEVCAKKLQEETGAPKKESLYAKACALTDGYSGRVLFGKEETKERANASTTKILTCIIALEEADLKDTVTASKRAAGQPRVRLGMKAGEKYKLSDLLYCLMLESFNDCAVAIAEHVAGSVEGFAAKMNAKAKEIGCSDSYFITPNGLDGEDAGGFHHTTAADLCRIMRYCAWISPQKDMFLKITQKQKHSFCDGQKNKHSVYNHNRLLATMQGAISGKTGYTSDAGYCYVMAYEWKGKRFCIALLGCGWPNNKTYKWKDANRLINYAKENYKCCSLFAEPKLSGIPVQGKFEGRASYAKWKKTICLQPYIEGPKKRKRYMLCSSDRITYQITREEKPGKQIGEYRISLNGECVETYPVQMIDPLREWEFCDVLSLIAEAFFLH